MLAFGCILLPSFPLVRGFVLVGRFLVGGGFGLGFVGFRWGCFHAHSGMAWPVRYRNGVRAREKGPPVAVVPSGVPL